MTAEEQPLISCRGIDKRYPGVVALDHVDIEIQRGKALGLVGKNGAGKSTLIKILAGAVQPDSGEMRVDGEVTTIDSPHRSAALGFAFVHQELTEIPNLTVAENVELGLGYPTRLGLLDSRALRRKAREVLDQLEYDIDPKARVDTLSLAQRRLVMIAHGMAADARLLVLDEPTASLTDAEIAHLHRVIRKLRDNGVTIVYVSHRLSEIFEVTDRVAVMRDGRVVHDSATGELTMRDLIGHITGGSVSAAERRSPRVSPQIGEEMLRVEDLGEDEHVLAASFAVNAGELLGIAGLVGAGRTELVRLIYGADRAASGAIYVRGERTKIRSPRDALRAGVVLLPEDRRAQGTVQDFSLRKNITLPVLKRFRFSSMLPMPSVKQERRSSNEMIERLQIKVADAELPVRTLSGGNQQKVVLAKWLECGASVFIFDEPTHGIDVEGKEDVYTIMEKLADDGNAVIFISSEFEELVGVCNRVLVMREGRLVDELAGERISNEALVERCYAA